MYAHGFRFYFTPFTRVLFAFPSRYWFTIGLSGVFSLAGWSRRIRSGLHVSRLTQDTAMIHKLACTGLSPSVITFSKVFHFIYFINVAVLLPRYCRNNNGLGFSPVARRYWGNHVCFLLLQVLRCFSSLRSPPTTLDNTSSRSWVVPFGNLWIKGHLHLPAAYRSLSRPSSPPRAKASAMRPCLLLVLPTTYGRYILSALTLLFSVTSCQRSFETVPFYRNLMSGE